MKRSAPAALRNRAPILETLRGIVRGPRRILEIGSGTGEHADFFTEQEPAWLWQPTEREPTNIDSVNAYRAESRRENFLAPVVLDAATGPWPPGPFDAVFSANVIHISPWTVALGILDGASRVLEETGVLILYGPFRFSGEFTAESNVAFDARLRGDDPSWGVRDLDDLRREATERGFGEPRVLPMPANNHVLVFPRGASRPSAAPGAT